MLAYDVNRDHWRWQPGGPGLQGLLCDATLAVHFQHHQEASEQRNPVAVVADLIRTRQAESFLPVCSVHELKCLGQPDAGTLYLGHDSN